VHHWPRDSGQHATAPREPVKKEQIDILKEAFEEWLQIHDLDFDFWIYTGDEWRARGESVLRQAEAVIAFDNQVVAILNFTGPWNIEEELRELANGFGYYFELGNVWNIGFYPLEGFETPPPPSTPYPQLLQDARWQAKRQRIISRSHGRCEECGGDGKRLEVHHCYYRYGRLPWQYPDGALLALCNDCHDRRGKAELRFRMFMTRLKLGTLEEMRKHFRAHAREWDDSSDLPTRQP
jgi:hypothetical protein